VAVAEGNKEIITLIGRRLREAASAEQEGSLPEAIARGLAQLSGIEGSIPIAPTGARPPEPQDSPPPSRPIGRCSSELAR
jgi:hypothetical protein